MINYIDLSANDNNFGSLNVNLKSYWATSPYLNLSFFPRSYYQCDTEQEIPVHSHFLGSGVASQKEIETKNMYY